MTLGCKAMGITKSEFVAKTQLLLKQVLKKMLITCYQSALQSLACQQFSVLAVHCFLLEPVLCVVNNPGSRQRIC